MMTEIFDPAAHRKPVDVHVAQRHEHGHEQAPVVEIFVFGHLFDHDDRTVGRSEYGLRILDSYAGRRTEKRSDEQDEQRSGTGHDPCGKRRQEPCADSRNENCQRHCNQNDGISLLMNFHPYRVLGVVFFIKRI